MAHPHITRAPACSIPPNSTTTYPVSPPPMPNSTLLAATDLSKLGLIIETELQSWLTHLSHLPQTTISTLTDNTLQTKTSALIHILETLPCRHRALVHAYNQDQIDISDTCSLLLEGLKNEAETLDLSGFYDHKLFRGKKFRQEAMAMEEEVRELEKGRLEELKELMGMFEELVILRDEGMLEERELRMLVEAMDDVGLSASSAVDEGRG